MKPILPEVAGSRLAAQRERDAARKIYEQQAKAAKKGFDEMNSTVELSNKERAPRAGMPLTESKRVRLVQAMKDTHPYIVASILAKSSFVPKDCPNPEYWARGCLREFVKPGRLHYLPRHRYVDWSLSEYEKWHVQ